jgi:hypothetical protein
MDMRNFLSTILLVLGFVTIFGASAYADAPSIEERMVLEQANVQMYSDMRHVAGWLDGYCLQNHRFPEGTEEMNWATNQLNQLIPNNPYRPSLITLIPGADENPTYEAPEEIGDVPQQYATAGNSVNRITLIFNPSLSDYMVTEYLTNPPDDWRAPPGSVTAISNNVDLFMLWGAGPDGKPLRDPVSKRLQLILGHYVLNFGGSAN